MPATMNELGLDRLSREDRIALADELWLSAAAGAEPGAFLTDAKRAELTRRLADADTDGGSSWDEVKAEMRARVREVRP